MNISAICKLSFNVSGRQAGLKLHPRKCHLLQHKVTYLGHVVSAQGIAPDPDKTDRVNLWPIPQSAKEVQQFLGLANYYRQGFCVSCQATA